MRAAGQDPAQALAKVKAWERRKSDFVLNRAELAVAKPKNSGIIKSLDIDDFYLMAEGHEIHQDVLDVIADVISEYEREGKAFFSETEFGEFYDSAIANCGVPGISDIAELDGAECIAETEVLLSRGESVPSEAMKLYRLYVKE